MPFYRLLLIILPMARVVSTFDQCDGEFCPPSPPKVRQFSFTTNFAPVIEEDQPTGCFCREDVKKFTICFGRNRCTRLPQSLRLKTNCFKLTNTHIKILAPDDFKMFSHLIDMQIEGNPDLLKVSSGAFAELHNLVNLSIAFNTKLNVLELGAFQGLIKLERLFLNNNAFQRIFDISSNLSPQVVPNLVTLVLNFNNIAHWDKNDFKPMANSKLEELCCISCRIEYIHAKALLHLKKLEKLYLSENTIDNNLLTQMLNNTVSAGINLDILDLSFMDFKKVPPKSMMEVIARSNISQLNLSKNQFEVVDNNSFPFMPNMKLLDLREVLAVQITDDAFSNLPNLRTLLISGNRLTRIPQGVENLRNLTFLDLQENSPGASFHIYFSLEHVEFRNMSHLVYLNLAFNGFAHLFDNSFLGLNNLKVLILKNCSIFHIENNSFAALKELRVLNLMNNLLVHEDAVPNVFFAQTKLEVLLLSGCKLSYISRKTNPFNNLKSLKYLALDKNQIKTLNPTDLQPLKGILTIDLSYNLLNSWEERLFSANVNLSRVILSKNKLTDLTVPMLQDFAMIGSIDLDQNAILCKCLVTYHSYKKWYSETNNDLFVNGCVFNPPIYCGYPDNLDNITVVDFLTNNKYGDTICSFKPDRIVSFLPLICTLLFFVVLAVLGFWYRWHIKYWIFLSKLYLSRKGKIKSKQTTTKQGYSNYEYDAFVSYSTEDRDFVVKLVTMMENHEPYLKLCVYERDFLIGTIISESVLESVAKSRKTVLIISENYAKSQWCRWESQICEHHRLFFENEDGEYVDDSLVLVRLTHVSETYLTPTLKYLLKTRIYLQWGWDEKKQEMFWNRLRSTLGPPISQLEITHM